MREKQRLKHREKQGERGFRPIVREKQRLNQREKQRERVLDR